MCDRETREDIGEYSDWDDTAARRGQHQRGGDVVEDFAEAQVLVQWVREARGNFARWLLHEGVDDDVGERMQLAPVAGDWGGCPGRG